MQGSEKRLLRVLDHIHENPAGNPSLDEIAGRAGWGGPRSLARAFALRFGWSSTAFRKNGEMIAA